MSNIEKQTVKGLLSQDNVKARFQEIMKDRAASFMANVAIISNSETLQKCEPITIISGAIVSASLNLPLDPNLGFASLVPFFDGKTKTMKAQFQLQYKGFIQLAIRSGQYKTIGAAPIFEGQLLQENPLTSDYHFDFSVKSEKVIGYAAYFKLVNGFEKTIYWPIQKIEAHGKRFSKTYQKGFGLWKDDFESMSLKTVIKHLISKWGILSIEMQNAVKFDQSVVKDITPETDMEYIDNEPEIIETPADVLTEKTE